MCPSLPDHDPVLYLDLWLIGEQEIDLESENEWNREWKCLQECKCDWECKRINETVLEYEQHEKQVKSFKGFQGVQ